jgi:hypothetical protein
MSGDCSVVPRRGRGSLCDVLLLADDWDSAEVNDAIAADFESGAAESSA